MTVILKDDPILQNAILMEQRRQRETIVLIASENYVSPAVMAATGSVLTNKYAEGYPGARYYAGCEYVDELENLAIERAKQIFGAEHVNVQPHSGAQANMAACFAVLEPGDRVLSMALDHGGHLSHGSPVNFSGRFYQFQHYGVDRETEVIDYEDIAKQARTFRPQMIIAGYSAYSRTVDFVKFSEIAKEVGAVLLADIAHIAGLVAGGCHSSPVGLAEVVTTTTHKTLRGPRGAIAMTSNKLARKYNSAVFPCTQGGPMMHTIAGKAAAFGEALSPSFKDYAHNVIANAKSIANELTSAGLRIVSGGTDNHLMLVDMRSLGITGAKAEAILEYVGIIVNKNTIPFDPEPPRVSSGIRIGSAAVTTRGMNTEDAKQVAQFILCALHNKDSKSTLDVLKEQVSAFASRFYMPVPYSHGTGMLY